MSDFTFVKTDNAPGAIGPYSQAVAVDGWLYCSGQIPLNPLTGELIEGDIAAQTDPVLKIKKSTIDTNNAWLIPILDPSYGFKIWSNLNMSDISDTTWSLLGIYPAGTTTVVDTGAISDTTTDKKFYYLED